MREEGDRRAERSQGGRFHLSYFGIYYIVYVPPMTWQFFGMYHVFAWVMRSSLVQEPGQDAEEEELAFAADVAAYFSKSRQVGPLVGDSV